MRVPPMPPQKNGVWANLWIVQKYKQKRAVCKPLHFCWSIYQAKLTSSIRHAHCRGVSPTVWVWTKFLLLWSIFLKTREQISKYYLTHKRPASSIIQPTTHWDIQTMTPGLEPLHKSPGDTGASSQWGDTNAFPEELLGKNQAGCGIWRPPPPTRCRTLSKFLYSLAFNFLNYKIRALDNMISKSLPRPDPFRKKS